MDYDLIANLDLEPLFRGHRRKFGSVHWNTVNIYRCSGMKLIPVKIRKEEFLRLSYWFIEVYLKFYNVRKLRGHWAEQTLVKRLIVTSYYRADIKLSVQLSVTTTLGGASFKPPFHHWSRLVENRIYLWEELSPQLYRF